MNVEVVAGAEVSGKIQRMTAMTSMTRQQKILLPDATGHPKHSQISQVMDNNKCTDRALAVNFANLSKPFFIRRF